MLQINERNRVYGEEIHVAIESKNSNYRQWLNEKLEYADLQEGKDFFTQRLKSTGGRPKTQYEFTLNAAKLIVLLEKNNKSREIYRWLCSLDNTECVLFHRTRKELLFEICLNEILSGIVKIVPQYKVLNYRLDFYIPELRIAIEYDEKAHHYINKEDKKRQQEIEAEIKYIKFVRINEGDENLGINLILKEILHHAYLKYEHELSENSDELMFLKNFDNSILDDFGKTNNERINEYFVKI
jgi:very-short-patch-repair endonuclease/phage anti-repressor protein